MQGECNFIVCRCGQTRPHGYFYGPGGRKVSALFASSHKTAVGLLGACIKIGVIPSEQETRLMCQIKTAGLSSDPEAERYDLTAIFLREHGCRQVDDQWTRLAALGSSGSN